MKQRIKTKPIFTEELQIEFEALERKFNKKKEASNAVSEEVFSLALGRLGYLCAEQVKNEYQNLEAVSLQDKLIQKLRRVDIFENINLSGKNLAGFNLYGLNLSGANLKEANLMGADLQQAVLDKANLICADLSRANLSGTNFEEASLQGARLCDAALREANFRGANLLGANLNRAFLNGAILEDACLQKTSFAGAELSWTVFSGANLYRANLSNATLYGAAFERAFLKGAILREVVLGEVKFEGVCLDEVNFQGAHLQKSQLSRSSFIEANFMGANLRESCLEGANLEGGNLERADLYGATLKNANLQGARMSEARLEKANLNSSDLRGANLYKTKLLEAELKRAKLEDAFLKEADLNGSNLHGANLEKTDFTGASFLKANFSEVRLRKTIFENATLKDIFIFLNGDNFKKAVKDFYNYIVVNKEKQSYEFLSAELMPLLLKTPGYLASLKVKAKNKGDDEAVEALDEIGRACPAFMMAREEYTSFLTMFPKEEIYHLGRFAAQEKRAIKNSETVKRTQPPLALHNVRDLIIFCLDDLANTASHKFKGNRNQQDYFIGQLAETLVKADTNKYPKTFFEALCNSEERSLLRNCSLSELKEQDQAAAIVISKRINTKPTANLVMEKMLKERVLI